MTEKLHKIKCGDWVWNIKFPEFLDPWFDDYPNFTKHNIIKSNRLRTVFKVCLSEGNLFVKYDHPSTGLGKFKTNIRSKVKSEFESAILLEKMKIPVVEYIGWGKKGAEGMLISRELPNSLSARSYWYDNAEKNKIIKENFLNNLASFLKCFFKIKLYHPDFHLGNLLIIPDKYYFCIVDPYGLRKAGGILRNSQLFKMQRIIGALRGELSDNEAISLILESSMSDNADNARKLWEKILIAEADEIGKFWQKRKKQILSGKSKYCQEINRKKGKIILRLSMAGNLIVPEEKINFSDSACKMVKLTEEKAEELWLTSFLLQFHRLPGKKPVAWLKNENGENYLFYEENEMINGEIDFSRRFKISGIEETGLT